MKNLLYKIGLCSCVLTIIFSLSAPIAFAQGNLFDSPIDDLQDKVGQPEQRIGKNGELETVSVRLIDFSNDSKWGGLSQEIITALESKGYQSIDGVMGDDIDSLKNILSPTFTKKQNETDEAYQTRLTAIASSVLSAYRIKMWGNLSAELADKLSGFRENCPSTGEAFCKFTSLNDIAQKAGYKQTLGNAQSLSDFLNKQKFLDSKGEYVNLTSDEVNLIDSEIRFKGESQLRSAVQSVAKIMRNLIGGIAILWIVVAGIQMIFAQGDETKVTEQKNSITYALIGLIVILLLERAITLLYGVPGVERGISTSNEGLNTEILGLVSFIKAIIGVAAMLMIVISGYRIISAEGEEEKITTQKKGILWVIAGIVVILINQFLVQNLYIDPVVRQIAANDPTKAAITQNNITNIINTFGTILQYLLGFVGIVAFAALIYGGASMVANFGNDEMVQNSKKIITNAIAGIIIVLSAFAIVSTVIKFG